MNVFVKAINATTVEVTFASAVSSDLDFSNFIIDGGLAITNAEISGKKVTLTTSSGLTRNKEYKVSLFGVKDAEGKDVVASGTFVWEVAEGTVVALGDTSLDKGGKTGLTVKDNAGKNVKDATVVVTSMNTNLVSVNHAISKKPSEIELTAVAAGSVDVKVVTTLPTGEKLTNTFKVTVKEDAVQATTAGFTLVPFTTDLSTSISTLTNPKTLANTRSFKDFAVKKTEIQLKASGLQDMHYLLPFDEVGGNPDTKYVDFKDAERVTISNAQVGSVALTNIGTATAEVEFTPIAAGKTNVNVFFKDGTNKSYAITVKAAPEIKSIKVDATQIDLSDEFVGGDATAIVANTFADSEEGVDRKLVTINALDQFEKNIDFDSTNSKVVISSSTEGISLFTGGPSYTTPVTTAGLTSISSGPVTFAVVAHKDTHIQNATVTVSYFKNATDAQATAVKTIKVNVADIKQDAVVADIDVNTVSEIDANYDVTTVVDYEGIDFTATTAAGNIAGAKIFSLDKDGNRLNAITTGIVAKVDSDNTEALKYVKEIASTKGIEFDTTAQALTYLRAASTVDVTVSAANVTKVLPITYKNSAVIPNKATVATSTIAIKGKVADVNSLSLQDIIFGQLDVDQLVLDDSDATIKTTITGTDVVSVKKTAKNNGYKFNHSLVTITGTDGKVLPTGSAVYGTDTSTLAGAANTWTNALVNGFNKTPFATTEFDVDFALANILATGSASVANGNNLTDAISISAGESVSFTLVITAIYADGSYTAIEGGGSAAQKAKHNLLAAPVQLNVSVSAE